MNTSSRLVRVRLLPILGVVVASMTNCAAATTVRPDTSTAGTATAPVTALTLAITKTFPHDGSCFVEGFQFNTSVSGGGFYESCGQTGASTMRVTNLKGKVVRSVEVPDVFAEGTVKLGDRLYQLTWRERVVFVRDPKTLAVTERRTLPEGITEGWGMTTNGKELMISDGTALVHFVDPAVWKVGRSITVRNGDMPTDQINELEMINGRLWANVWRTEQILVMDPATGRVVSTVALAGLRPTSTANDPEAVANGIAYDAKTKRIFVTGKNWPVVYQVVTKPA